MNICILIYLIQNISGGTYKKHRNIYNKNVDIKFSAHDVLLEQPSSGTLKVERLESHSNNDVSLRDNVSLRDMSMSFDFVT